MAGGVDFVPAMLHRGAADAWDQVDPSEMHEHRGTADCDRAHADCIGGALSPYGRRKGTQFWGYHYVDPGALLLADWRVQHQKLDRMVNTIASFSSTGSSATSTAASTAAGPADASSAVDGMVQFFRDFMDEHFRALRRDQVGREREGESVCAGTRWEGRERERVCVQGPGGKGERVCRDQVGRGREGESECVRVRGGEGVSGSACVGWVPVGWGCVWAGTWWGGGEME
jgi:hypothetical protein